MDLPWEDVLVPHVLCHLPLQHLVSLQRVSKQFHSLIQVYLANCRTFDLSSVSPRESLNSLQVYVERFDDGRLPSALF